MVPPAQGSREQKLSDGLRKLQEFQRRKEQMSAQSSAMEPSVARGATPSQSPQAPRVSLDAAKQQQQPQHHSTLNASQSPSQMVTVLPAAVCTPVGSTAAVVSPVTITPAADDELGARLQHLIGQLAAVAASDTTRDLHQLEELQRHCIQLSREANEAQKERQAQTAQFDSLRSSHLQATRTIELLVEEKSRLRTSLESLEGQLRARAHEAVVRDAEIRSLRERAAITDGQVARLLQEKEEWNREAKTDYFGSRMIPEQNTSRDPVPGACCTRLQEQMTDLEEQVRLSAEKIAHFQRAEEQSRAAYKAARNELEVAQAYVQQLAGTTGDSEGLKAGTSNRTQALHTQLELLREELESEKHERSASELIARNLEASNRGLQQRVVELERSLATTTVQQPLQQAEGRYDNYTRLERYERETQTDSQEPDGSGADPLVNLSQQNEELQTQLIQSQQQLCNERDRWSKHTAALQSRMAANADDLQRAKLDASRAVSQNRQLKSQIEELQDVFVKLSNDKLDLTEDVHRERHRAQQLETQLRHLQPTFELQQAQKKKKAELESTDTQQERPEPNSIAADQLQRYELQVQRLEAQLADWTARYASLERQHAQYVMQHKIEARSHQEQIKSAAAHRPADDEGSCEDTPHTLGDSPGESLSLSEYEFVDTPRHGSQQLSTRHALAGGDTISSNNNNNNNNDNRTNNDNERDTNFMSERVHQVEVGINGPIIDRDDKSQLEHKVEQLRMETDTISDYIQLYQQQRAALNQRQRERDVHIKQLLEDREALSSKVNQLQSLIAKILPPTSSQQQGINQETIQASSSGETDFLTVSGASIPTRNEMIAHKILQTLEDLTEVSTAPPAGLNTFYRCSSCQGCHGRLLSL
ncbi:golgin subfamily A member 2-like [Tropilaelaps mercedesae]|uniref:Golgin subfamily A member 2-like n=1 Tax=Tropilaelaps mercedesae TaxID=418985 RepID=A0A1V9XNV1_9ACAR|nr:golgin subfamily A member 2-like [Tropilaelaps mercedesae]